MKLTKSQKNILKQGILNNYILNYIHFLTEYSTQESIKRAIERFICLGIVKQTNNPNIYIINKPLVLRELNLTEID